MPGFCYPTSIGIIEIRGIILCVWINLIVLYIINGINIIEMMHSVILDVISINITYNLFVSLICLFIY